MIKSIFPGSVDVTVSGGGMSSMPYINPTYSGAGMLKFDPASQNFQVNDGTNWINIPNDTVSIDLSYESKKALEWARQKRREELELEELAKTNPAINDLVNQIKEKQNQLEMVKTLIKNDKDFDEVEPQAYQAP
jgi:hypothetical protein